MDNTVFLNTNREMPLLGLGVYKATGENEAENAIISAVESGYRLIDTASVYKNEENVGRGIASCGIPRNELFITTKVWNTAQRLGDIQGAFERSLDRLKLDYVDLYLIHWPVPGCYLSTWKVLEEIQKSGRALSIGVSNFEIRHLEELEANSGIIPAVNQIECHPLCYPKELIDYCQDKGIQVQAYAPLARGAYLDNDVMCVLGGYGSDRYSERKFPQFTCSRGFKGHCILININRKSILSCNINAKSRCIYITSAFCIYHLCS